MVVAVLVVFGLCLGSFINALVYRLHWQETHEKAGVAEKKLYSIRKGRSLCPSCKHQLSSKDLIPVFSWLMLKGKCRYCKQPISWQYPFVEASTALLFVASYLYWPYGLSAWGNILAFVLWLVFLTGFMALAVYDFKYLILPNRIIFPLGFLAVTGLVIETIASHDLQAAKTATIGLLIGGGIFYVLFQISNGAWIGGGDVKLGFLLGLLVGGPGPAFLMLFLASALGSIYSTPMLLTRKAGPRSRIPFGPFLIVAAILVQLFGASIISWYENLSSLGY